MTGPKNPKQKKAKQTGQIDSFGWAQETEIEITIKDALLRA
jgi:hypothetical protein